LVGGLGHALDPFSWLRQALDDQIPVQLAACMQPPGIRK
jgi:hypothetical protein